MPSDIAQSLNTGALTISLDRLKSIDVDQSTGIATIGGGQRLGDVALGLFEQGERGISHGTCPGVGIGGHAVSGGFGLNARAHGLTLDAIVAHHVALVNGTVIRVSNDSHADLYWALRGGGGSPGIVVAYEAQTFAAPSQNTLFDCASHSLWLG